MTKEKKLKDNDNVLVGEFAPAGKGFSEEENFFIEIQQVLNDFYAAREVEKLLKNKQIIIDGECVHENDDAASNLDLDK